MTRKRILYAVLILAGAALTGISVYLNSLLPIITGYAAKNLCSAVFVSGRMPKDVEALDLNFSFIRYTRNSVDYAGKSVTSHFLWSKSKAIYREGFGTTLLRDVPEQSLRRIKYPAGARPSYMQDTVTWPMGDLLRDTATGIDMAALQEISRKLIVENAYRGNAFAFMVLHKGIPVAEEYKPQFSRHTRFLSWSMAKSFTNALMGILVRQGRIDINKPAGIETWKNDDRSKITPGDLMHMQSGLKWNEDYGNRSDVTVMLHCESDMGSFASEKPLAHPSGTFWHYSSGTANIVSSLIRSTFGNDSVYYSFVHSQLFNRAGMPDAVFEVDPSGTLVGSSYLYATARDYARFGLLYQNDGVFNGERILPEGWVRYCTTAVPSSNGAYGSLFWLNQGKRLPSVPVDTYSCEGHDGQGIYIIPSKQLVVVVLGYSPRSVGGMDFDRLLKDILSTLR